MRGRPLDEAPRSRFGDPGAPGGSARRRWPVASPPTTPVRAVLVRRFAARVATGGPEHAAARQVAGHGGDALLRKFHDDVHGLAAADPAAVLVEAADGDVEATYAAIRAALA